MNAEGTNRNQNAQLVSDGKVPIHQTEPPQQEPPQEKGIRRFLLPTIIGLALVGGLGWIVFTRFILPLLFSGHMKPQPTPVVLANPKSTTIADSSDYAATLDSRQSVTLQPRVSGQISEIYVKAGDRVEAGEQILQIDASEQRAQVASRNAALESTAADIEAAQADVANARDTLKSLQARRASNIADVQLNQSEYKRYQDLYTQGASSQQVLDQKLNALRIAQANLNQVDAEIRAQQSTIARAQSTVTRNERSLQQAQATVAEGQAQLRYYSITAPFAGVVGNIPVKVGDFVDTSTQLLRITQNQQLEVQIGIPLERAAALRRGLAVQLLNDQNQVVQTGSVSFIAPNVDPTTQSIQVKASFNNTGGKLRTEQFIRARVVWSNRPGVLVPTTAISRLAGKDFLFVAMPFKNSGCQATAQAGGGAGGSAPAPDPEQLVAVQTLVTLGKIVGNDQEVQDGLKSSDRFATSGILSLQNCMPIADASSLPHTP